MKVTDLADTIAPGRKQEIIGIRPGEKMHEQMIGCEDAPFTFEYDQHFKILPSIYSWGLDPNRINDGIKVRSDFTYTSDNNQEWMTKGQLEEWLNSNKSKIGQF